MSDADDDFWLRATPIDPAFRADPHPVLRALRERAPVERTPVGVWRLTRYADCRRLLTEARTGVRTIDGVFPAEALLPNGGPALFMLQQDPPNHTRLRRLVSKAFTPRAVELLRGRVQRLADELVDAALPRGEMDLIGDYALPIPSTIICEMLGVPVGDRTQFTAWTAEATHLLAAMIAPPDVIERAQAAVASLQGYFEELVAERRQHLRNDILSDLIRAEEAGDRLTSAELVAQCRGLLIAGFETTIGLIGNGALALLRHPDALRLVREEPGLIASAVDECLRFDGPIQLTVRYLHEDTRFGDVIIPSGAQVWAMLLAANRDPAQFPDPDRFDVRRRPNDHLAFGGGAHFCLGVYLARLEGEIALGTLFRRLGDVCLVDRELQWSRSLFRVLSTLPIAFRGAGVEAAAG